MADDNRPSIREAWNDLRTATRNATTPKNLGGTDNARPAPAAMTQRKRSWHTLPSATFKGDDGQFQLYPDGVDHLHRLQKTTIPLSAIRSVSLEDGADLEARITATRLVLLGVFSLAFRKRSGGERYLTIESDDAVVVVRVDRKQISKAQKFAAAVRTAMKNA